MKSRSDSAEKKRSPPSPRLRQPNGKNERKRRRTAQPALGESNERLLKILTGADNEARPSDKPKQQADGSAPEVQQPPDPHAHPPRLAATENVQEATKNDKPTGETWRDALSEAHASKINVTVLLANANLETVRQPGRSGGLVLLNCEDHKHLLRKSNRDANDARPDITHQCLLALMDSPLNKAGRLKVYIRTAKKVLIEVQPQTRIPRTIRRFSGLVTELLEKFKVRGTSGSVPLLKVIRNPITSYLPAGTRKVICTYNTDNVVDMREHASRMARLATAGGAEERGKVGGEDLEENMESVNVLYVIGAMAHGKVMEDWADEYICVSEYPLSAATVCSRLTYSYECLLGIV